MEGEKREIFYIDGYRFEGCPFCGGKTEVKPHTSGYAAICNRGYLKYPHYQQHIIEMNASNMGQLSSAWSDQVSEVNGMYRDMSFRNPPFAFAYSGNLPTISKNTDKAASSKEYVLTFKHGQPNSPSVTIRMFDDDPDGAKFK